MKNREKLKYIAVGMVLATVVSSIGLATVFNRKADLDFNKIKLVVNNKPIISNNILYEGTTYIPIRDVAEILGGTVDFDIRTNTANIVLNNGLDNTKTIENNPVETSNTNVTNMDLISAVKIFEDKYPKARIKDIEYKLNRENPYYEIEGLDEDMEYEIKIGLDASILDEKSEIADRDAKLKIKYKSFTLSDMDGLRTIDEIENVATRKVNGEIKNIKLSKEDDNFVYEVEIIKEGKEFDIDINAISAKILRIDD